MNLIKDRGEVYNILNNILNTIYSKTKARNLYNFYLGLCFEGYNNVRIKNSKSSFYRNLKFLKSLNIDISQKYDIDLIDNTIDFNPFKYKEVV